MNIENRRKSGKASQNQLKLVKNYWRTSKENWVV